MRQKQELLRKANRKAPLTTQPTRCQYVKQSESDLIAQVCACETGQRTAYEAEGGFI